MRLLSDLTSGDALDVLAEITEPAMNIMQDEALMETLKNKNGGKLTVAQAKMVGANKIVEIVAVIAKSHKKDLFALFAPFFEQSAKQLEKMKFLEFAKGISGIAKDKEFIDFLSCLQADTSQKTSTVPLQDLTAK